MKLTNATWEERNLGVRCTEVAVSAQDTPEILREALLACPGEYIVVRLPIAHPDLSTVLAQLGFTFVETMFRLEKILDDAVLQPPTEAARQMSYLLDDPQSMQRVMAQIGKGMFITDRVSLDPAFAPEQTATRYRGFLEDELARGARLLEFFHQGAPFGFSCLRALDSERYYQALTGIYKEKQGKGLGFALGYLPSLEVFRQGGRSIATGVSTNNTVSLRVHLKCGFLPVQTTYVFIRHSAQPHCSI